jgi:hypothetical protein
VTKSPNRPSASGKNDPAKAASGKSEPKNDQVKSDPPRPQAAGAAESKSSESKAAESKAVEPVAKPDAKPDVKPDAGKNASPDTRPSGSGASTPKVAAPAKPAAAAPSAAPSAATAPSRSAPTAQPSPAVRRPVERSGTQRSASASQDPRTTQDARTSQEPRATQTSMASLVVAGVIGGLVAGAGFIAYDLMRAQPAGDPERIAALEQRVEQLSQSEPAAVDLSGVEGRLADLEAQTNEALATAQEAAGRTIPQIPTDAIAANEQAVAALGGQVEQNQQAVASLGEQANANAQAIEDLRAGAQNLQPRIEEIAGEVSAIRQEFAPEWRDAASQAAAANHVSTAIATGRPYAEAYQTLAALGAPQDMLAAIEPFAESGAPGSTALLMGLRESFSAARAAQVQDAPPPGSSSPPPCAKPRRIGRRP